MNDRNAITIPEPRLERAGPDLWRLVATVEGTEVFFEASVPLSPRPEVLVCPFLLPAMSNRSDLEVAAPVDATFLENLKFVRKRATEWWPTMAGGEVRAAIGSPSPKGPHSAVFYSGGADSSYALQQLHSRLRYAVFAAGFDIPLEDFARLKAARDWVGSTVRRCGLELIEVRTNLRRHPLFRQVSWEITHVSALAAVAHALGEHVHTMYVAASDVLPPWGSAPDLDAAWSSESVKIENFGAELTRLQRVASIARWPPLRGHLKVCWENKSPDLNCGFCEKCLRTRMQLLVSGAPDGLDSFPPSIPLRSTLGRLYSVHHELHGQWREMAAHLEDRALRKKVDRLLRGEGEPIFRRSLRLLRQVGAGALRRLRPRRTSA